MDLIKRIMKTNRKGYLSHDAYKQKALKLLQIKAVPTTEVCEYIYGSKSKKSTLNQKKTGVSPLMFQESMKIIEFYGLLLEEIDKILNE